ncbi:Uncharacterised protein [Klebsiella aerogenes]|nr:Uncharacterised protein [Klebsiella aerogenes]
MDLIYKQHVVRFEVGEHRGEIARFLQHRAGGGAQIHPHLIGDNVRQGGFPQPRRAKNQQVIEGVAAQFRRLDKDLHLGAHLRLADILCQHFGRMARSTASSAPLLSADTSRSASIIPYLTTRRAALRGLAFHCWRPDGQSCLPSGCLLRFIAQRDQRGNRFLFGIICRRACRRGQHQIGRRSETGRRAAL